MKRLIYIWAFLLLGLCIPAQISLYGDFSTSISSNIPDDEDYESLLNPGNLAGMTDISMSHSMTTKLSGSDELANMEVWFSLGRYPIGQQLMAVGSLIGQAGLTGMSSSDPYTAGMSQILMMTPQYTADLIKLTGDHFYTFDLQRAVVSWYLGESIRVKMGRQSMLTGYGYAWNPMDFANPLKNPSSPDADLKGVDALLFHLFPYSIVNMKVYGMGEVGFLQNGVSYDNLLLGGELTASIPFVEFKVTGLYDRDDNDGEDARVSAVGAGLLADIAGLGLYGEIALYKGGRTLISDGTGVSSELFRKSEDLYSGVAGIEYTFPFELTLIAEFFYNGEGYDKDERGGYFSALEILNVNLDYAHYSMYRPGYFSKQYLLVNLMYPIYDLYTDINVTSIYSIDSGALSVIPTISWSPSGALKLDLSYTGLFSLEDNQYDENELSPIKNIISFKVSFSF